jgi:hypothetical protein
MGVDEPQHRAELADITHRVWCPAARASTPRAVSEEQCWVGVVVRDLHALRTPAWPRAIRFIGSTAALHVLRLSLPRGDHAEPLSPPRVTVLVRRKGDAHGQMQVMEAARRLQMARRARTPGRADRDCFRLHSNATHEAPGA